MHPHFMASMFVVSATSIAQVSLVQNGSFEIGPSIPAGQTQVTVSGNQLPGWVIPAGDVDNNSVFWSPTDGVRSVDLHGITIGAIEQAIVTVPDQAYSVVFDLGATGQTAQLQVSAAGQTSPVYQQNGGTFPIVTYTIDLMWTFTATNTSAVIRFDSRSTSSAANGPHIDNVRVYARPGGTFATFGSGCPGSNGSPLLGSMTVPVLGQPFAIELSRLPTTFSLVFGIVGLSNSVQSGRPLPLDLRTIGMPGCVQLVSIDATYPMLSHGGPVTWPISMPNDPLFAGFPFYVQAFVPELGINALGATTSNAGYAMIGF